MNFIAEEIDSHAIGTGSSFDLLRNESRLFQRNMSGTWPLLSLRESETIYSIKIWYVESHIEIDSRKYLVGEKYGVSTGTVQTRG